MVHCGAGDVKRDNNCQAGLLSTHVALCEPTLQRLNLHLSMLIHVLLQKFITARFPEMWCCWPAGGQLEHLLHQLLPVQMVVLLFAGRVPCPF